MNNAICPELSGHFTYLEADIKVKDVNDKGREKGMVLTLLCEGDFPYEQNTGLPR